MLSVLLHVAGDTLMAHTDCPSSLTGRAHRAHRAGRPWDSSLSEALRHSHPLLVSLGLFRYPRVRQQDRERREVQAIVIDAARHWLQPDHGAHGVRPGARSSGLDRPLGAVKYVPLG